MQVTRYERLSQIYDAGWSQLISKYVDLVGELSTQFGIRHPTLLDLACGTGALLKALASKGFRADGLDLSPHMIKIAKGNAAGIANATFSVGDMAEFQSDQQYDIVTCTFDSINYLRETNEVQSMFRCVASVLNPNGIFVFDSNCEPKCIAHHGKVFEKEIDRVKFRQLCFYDESRKESLVRFEFEDGTIEEHRQRPYNIEELRPMLSAAGLEITECFTRFDKTPYDKSSLQVICICRKTQ
jgi:2-polyprenyl-3-methyl-5-hydroxy-6-metoxy-1,4-benzoquinol methylase